MWRAAETKRQSTHHTDDAQELDALQQQWLEKQSGRQGAFMSDHSRDAPGMHQRTCSQTDTAYSSSPQSPTHASGSGLDSLEGVWLQAVIILYCYTLVDVSALVRS